LVTELREIFRVFDKKEAKERLENLLKKSEILPEFLKDFLNDKVVKDFDKLTVFLDDGLIPKTSNHAERYFSKTLSKENKNKFKTDKGLLSHLHWRMIDTTEIYMKKIQHPNF
jgi:hypothetical protein